MTPLRLLAVLLLIPLMNLAVQADANTPATPLASLYDYKVHALDGTAVDLAKYKGNVTLVVNVASRCGFTKQYPGLVRLQDDYRDKGFTILAFPSNDFGGQEPGTAAEISTFCTTKYHVNFPLLGSITPAGVFEKVDVKGPTKAPVYQFLTTGFPEPTWNFCKYLVGKDGKVIKEYPSPVTPEDATLRADIDAAIKAK